LIIYRDVDAAKELVGGVSRFILVRRARRRRQENPYE